jgi:hypothetical protein
MDGMEVEEMSSGDMSDEIGDRLALGSQLRSWKEPGNSTGVVGKEARPYRIAHGPEPAARA